MSSCATAVVIQPQPKSTAAPLLPVSEECVDALMMHVFDLKRTAQNSAQKTLHLLGAKRVEITRIFDALRTEMDRSERETLATFDNRVLEVAKKLRVQAEALEVRAQQMAARIRFGGNELAQVNFDPSLVRFDENDLSVDVTRAFDMIKAMVTMVVAMQVQCSRDPIDRLEDIQEFVRKETEVLKIQRSRSLFLELATSQRPTRRFKAQLAQVVTYNVGGSGISSMAISRDGQMCAVVHDTRFFSVTNFWSEKSADFIVDHDRRSFDGAVGLGMCFLSLGGWEDTHHLLVTGDFGLNEYTVTGTFVRKIVVGVGENPICVDADDKTIVASDGRKMWVFNATDGSCKTNFRLFLYHENPPTCCSLALLSDGVSVAVAANCNHITILELKYGREIRTICQDEFFNVSRVCATDDELVVANGNYNTNVFVISLNETSGNCVKIQSDSPTSAVAASRGRVFIVRKSNKFLINVYT